MVLNFEQQMKILDAKEKSKLQRYKELDMFK